MDTFVPNPGFDTEVREAARRALDDLGNEIERDASRYISPYSSGAARAVKKSPATSGYEPSVRISIGKGLGRIFEYSKQQNRHTRKGANRGVMQRREFYNRAINEAVRRGLDLRKHLH